MKASCWNNTTIVPRDLLGRILFFLPIYFAGFMYFGELVLSGFFVGNLGIWLTAFFWIGPAICVVLPFFAYLIGLIVYIIRFPGKISLVLVLICGYLLARFLPVPPTPEEILFSWQSAKYEEVVEMARTQQLQHDDLCHQTNQFAPPSGYVQWSNECIYVGQQNGVVVEFAPRSLERPILYLENPTQKSYVHSLCNGTNDRRNIHEGFVFKEISKHWFICKRLLDS